MGYQESFRPIHHLAEAAGIKRAIEDYEDYPDLPEYCRYCCASREKGTENLYACIGGQRCRVHIIASMDLDYCIPYKGKYGDYYEDIDETQVEAAAKEHPDLVEKAYYEVAACFVRAAKNRRRENRENREEALALWPEVARFLQIHGPSSESRMSVSPRFKGKALDSALVDLVRQGLLDCSGEFFLGKVALSAKAREELGLSENSAPSSVEERIDLALWELGPSRLKEISTFLGLTSYQTRKLLNQQIEKGDVVVEESKRVRRYRRASEGEVANEAVGEMESWR